MQTKYSKEFKIEAVKKVLLRNRETSIASVARSIGITKTTLYLWVKVMTNAEFKESPTSGGKIQKSSYSWTSSEKMEAIIESSKFSGEELSEYCRKQGLFPHHLEAWKREFISHQDKTKIGNANEAKKLKNENKALTVELRRKEKALAETAALLVLKKKVYTLWERDEEG